MIFQKCWIVGENRIFEKDNLNEVEILFKNPYQSNPPIFYSNRMIESIQNQSQGNELFSSNMNLFWTLMATCHTVVVGEGGELDYQAQSPDEAALVSAGRDCGFVFLGRTTSTVQIWIQGVTHEFALLNVLEFSSLRKRMGVILKNAQNEIFLFCKGADSVICERLAPGQDEIKAEMLENLESFASEGLRTLCLAYRKLSEDEYERFEKDFHQAGIAMEDREFQIERACNVMEQNLVLLGATAIEDKLQAGVPEAIHTLSRAGIHLWVLTGDKTETAINIGFACNLVNAENRLIQISGRKNNPLKDGKEAHHHVHQQLVEAFKLIRESESQVRGSESSTLSRTVLVIDGDAISSIFQEEDSLKDIFLRVCLRCQHVLCCRMSPKQKADIVRLVRQGVGAITLAIGDGANDVSMIQEANVGVGIAGEEGMQAVLASDYAIGQFRFLVKLLLVHGRWSYLRSANMIFNFFYKNMTWVFIMFWYQFYAGYVFSISIVNFMPYLVQNLFGTVTFFELR
jgi:phospholipid-translocating ATPase